jgi:hypothetical protein
MKRAAKKKQAIRTPKRGAIPTPRELLAAATPYVPENVEGAKQPAPQQGNVAAQPSNSRRVAMAKKSKSKGGPRSPMRGAIPTSRHELAAATPYRMAIGAPPTHLIKPAKLSMWGNDVHGDCVTAEEAFAKACHSPEIFITDKTVIAWATKHGVLEGANLNQVLQFMQADGFPQGGHVYDDGPFFSLDWTNPGVLTSAISQGPVKIGIAADQVEAAWRTTKGRSGWFGTGFHSDVNEDHCVSLCGYGTLMWLAQQFGVKVPAGIDGSKPGYAMFTWNSIGIIDQPSMIAITHEAWLRNPTTIIK